MHIVFVAMHSVASCWAWIASRLGQMLGIGDDAAPAPAVDGTP